MNTPNVCPLQSWIDFFRNDNSLEIGGSEKAQSDEMKQELKQEPIQVLEGVKVQIEEKVDPIT